MSSVIACGSELFDAMNEMKACGAWLKCGVELVDGFTIAIKPCIPEFYRLCDFERIIHICPFDPAWDAFQWKHGLVNERVEALEVRVKELEAKLPKRG